jgi:hypothetical protein
VWPETVFAELKNARGMSRARLRGINNVQTEALVVATARNILKMTRRFLRLIKATEVKACRALSSVAVHFGFDLGLVLVQV